MSRDCLCLMLALCCQDVSSLGNRSDERCLSVFSVCPRLSRCLIFRERSCDAVWTLGMGAPSSGVCLGYLVDPFVVKMCRL